MKLGLLILEESPIVTKGFRSGSLNHHFGHKSQNGSLETNRTIKGTRMPKWMVLRQAEPRQMCSRAGAV